MFTVREHVKTAADFANTLRKIREIGYEAVQLSGVGAMNGEAPEVDAKLARRMLDDNGLRCIATHRPWENIKNEPESEIEFHHTIGCDYAAIGGISGASGVEEYRTFIQEATAVCRNLNPAGIRFGHHNHVHEFARTVPGGPTFEDLLIDQAPPELMLELDLYWVEHAGYNCVRILERCHGRVPVIHIKDKEVILGKNETRMAPIGEGNMDWPAIIQAGEAAGVRWYAVEQDQCYRDPFDCLKASYEYLRSQGL